MDSSENINIWPSERASSFRKIDKSDIVDVLRYEFMDGSRQNSTFLHTFAEKLLYTFHDWSRYGRIYRCKDRKCPARITLLPSGECVRLNTNKLHKAHTIDYEQEIKNFKAHNSMKRKAVDLRTIAGGRRIKKVKDIFTEVMVE